MDALDNWWSGRLLISFRKDLSVRTRPRSPFTLGLTPFFGELKMNNLERTLEQIDKEILAIEEAYPDNYEDRDDWQDLVDEVTDLELNIVRLER